MSRPNYRIYPTLLGKFQEYLDSDKAFEDFWNVDAEGNYKRSCEEIAAEREQALLDAVNRVPFESEAADKGTAFNQLIDWLLDEDAAVTVRVDCGDDQEPVSYTLAVNGADYTFRADLAQAVAGQLQGAVAQYRCEGTIDTRYGEVLLYGYADYILCDAVIDLKTTSRYEFLKFEHGWQRWLYPYCLVQSGDMPAVSAFDYLAVQWRELRGEPLGGTIYRESYGYDHTEAERRLRACCERFIEWLEAHREQITDTKIFGL